MKYHYNLMRPVTYINRFIDPSWQTLVPSPPYPEYPSALAYIYGGVMQVLTRELGDNIPVTDNTYIPGMALIRGSLLLFRKWLKKWLYRGFKPASTIKLQ